MRQLFQLTFLSVLSGERITQGTLVYHLGEALLRERSIRCEVFGPFNRRGHDRGNAAGVTIGRFDALEEREGRNISHLTLKLVLVELQVLEVVSDRVTHDHFVVQDFL